MKLNHCYKKAVFVNSSADKPGGTALLKGSTADQPVKHAAASARPLSFCVHEGCARMMILQGSLQVLEERQRLYLSLEDYLVQPDSYIIELKQSLSVR